MRYLKLHLAFATDSRYLLPTKVAAGSAIAWSSRRDDLVVDILDCGISDDEWLEFESTLRERFGFGFELVRHRIDMSRYDNMASWHGSKGLYARLELPNILNTVNWCIYGDGDTLFTDDPFQLLEFFDDKFALWGHKDDFGKDQVEWHRRHNLPWDCASRICSGFLVINLEWFRKHDGVNECFKFIRSYPDLLYPDQDALNYVCRGSIGLLPDGWGCFSLNSDSVEDINCIHYTIERPWQLKLSRRFPIVSTMRIWFIDMSIICNMHRWECPGMGLFKYCCGEIKTSFWMVVGIILSLSPQMRTRWKRSLNRHWNGQRVRGLVMPSNSIVNCQPRYE